MSSATPANGPSWPPAADPVCRTCGQEMARIGPRVWACATCRVVHVRCPACDASMRPTDDGYWCAGCGLLVVLPDALPEVRRNAA